MSVLHLDFECFSSLDLKKCGLENYIAAPDFTVTVIAWAFDDGPVQAQIWPDNHLPDEVFQHIQHGGEVRAHNAGFEYAVLADYYRVTGAVSQFCCTMQKALSYGLPAGLLKAGKALGLQTIKDESKRRLMLSMGRPRKGQKPWHEVDPAKLAELAAYCIDDVKAERALDRAVPDLHPWEKQLSELDMKINRKGVMLDRDAIRVLRAAAGYALHEIDAECARLTQGDVTRPGSQTLRLVTWLQNNGLFNMPDVAKATVEGALKGNAMSPTVRRVLELRQQAAKSSVAKLDRMLDVMSKTDDRARNLLQFAGAGRTLRWAGRLVQPQNLPRTMGVLAEQVISAAKIDLGALGLLWGSGMEAVSRSLRSCFIAKPGHVLVSLDLSQIEARVLAWLAGQRDVLDAFSRGEDVYVLAASKVGSTNRQLGKVLTLACGFGMGGGKFRDTAAAAPYYIELSPQEALRHLQNWRRSNSHITGLWDVVENTVRQSVASPGVVLALPHNMAVMTSVIMGTTRIRKPNGVKLTYHNMRFWKGELIFDGVNSTTKNWGIEKAYGGRLVENLVQSIARDVMGDIMLKTHEHAGFVPVMSVHDEIVWESKDDQRPDMRVWVTAPAWAPGLPLAADLNVGVRYAK